ncbi:hypothetical protein BgiBS90_013799 [Biomphalaria glabrata]|nr:hypothetical protein BgiBS90_013799 [Biomphalaria glabrata]
MIFEPRRMIPINEDNNVQGNTMFFEPRRMIPINEDNNVQGNTMIFEQRRMIPINEDNNVQGNTMIFEPRRMIPSTRITMFRAFRAAPEPTVSKYNAKTETYKENKITGNLESNF